MNINELTDDCLLHIFDLFNHLEILVRCSEVCPRWESLVKERLRTVKYLADHWKRDSFPVDTIFYNTNQLVKLEISQWLPNLKIIHARNFDGNFISNLSVKGVLLHDYEGDLRNITLRNSSVEMLAVSHFVSFFTNYIQGPMIKQLHVTHTNLIQFSNYAKYFPNLTRLHIENYIELGQIDCYTGPVLANLEILEIHFHENIAPIIYYGFSLADRCPALKSAYHHVPNDLFEIDGEMKNQFLESLVIQIQHAPAWEDLETILRKYPNLKHLSIKDAYNTGISDDHIPMILDLLSRLVLLDIRLSRNVTQKSVEFIDWYNKLHNRSISFLYQKNTKLENWSHLSDKWTVICQGLDFMKNCFSKKFYHLPRLMDPDD